MRNVRRILRNLQDTDRTLDRLSAHARQNPEDDTVRVNWEEVVKRRGDLERWLHAELNSDQLDLLEYKIERSDGAACSVRALAASVLLFQELVTVIFDAIRDEPKRRYSPLSDNIEQSTFECFTMNTGPVAVVSMVIPNERLLAIKSDLDAAFDLLFRLMQAQNTRDLRDIAKQAGIAAISRLHAWAEHSVMLGLDVSVGWSRFEPERPPVRFSREKAKWLTAAVEKTVEEIEEEFEIICHLTAIDDGASRFRVISLDGVDIEGSLADDFPRGAQWTTRSWYDARLLRETVISFESGKERVQWTLQSLEPSL